MSAADQGSPSMSGSCTDISEDSVEIRSQPINIALNLTSPLPSLSKRNKRKASEPRKFKELSEDSLNWSSDDDPELDVNPTKFIKSFQPRENESDLSKCQETNQQQQLPSLTTSSKTSTATRNSVSNENGHFILNLPFDIRNILGTSADSLLKAEDDDVDDDDINLASNQSNQRNYKVMTRQRRIEANARERTRVHTISAAFENLRRAVPSFSCHQKLSKLAILKIAISYILTLANLNDLDYSSDDNKSGECPNESSDSTFKSPTFAQCVDICTKTIQLEGKVRKRKA
ncbi:hypothetical protein CHUAL_005519 [Chamberlinius hualienensis]